MGSQTTYLFAGGGTGGHLYPGLAIAEKLRELAGGDAARAKFLCSTRPLDAELLAAEGAEFAAIDASPFGVSPRRLVKFVTTWGKAVSQASEQIRSAGAKVHVVAMGGFVAAPAVRAAKKLGVPVTLVNLDAVPGLANRWIAGRADAVYTALPVPGRNWTVVRPIVRGAAMAPGDAAHCRKMLGLDALRPTLLVTGASQGASTINAVMQRLVKDRPTLLAGWQVIHQTGAPKGAPKGEAGRSEIDDLRSAYRGADIPAVVEPYFKEMGVCWGAADAALSRSGAGSVAEAWANRVPTVFMPYPHHKDQHQKFNAMPLVDVYGAVLVEDRIDAGANAAPLATTLTGLVRNPARLAAMRAALEKLGPADGAEGVARALLGEAAGEKRFRAARAA
jgi:UDP-N-acetylglucosamine--N-acetylmuramyl-(pentapeptide) pyrophosphoryl-undecaprenol N-acetylglucosamine transferase